MVQWLVSSKQHTAARIIRLNSIEFFFLPIVVMWARHITKQMKASTANSEPPRKDLAARNSTAELFSLEPSNSWRMNARNFIIVFINLWVVSQAFKRSLYQPKGISTVFSPFIPKLLFASGAKIRKPLLISILAWRKLWLCESMTCRCMPSLRSEKCTSKECLAKYLEMVLELCTLAGDT